MMVTQNNELRTLTVVGMNDYVQTLLGYTEPISDAPLVQFLGTKTAKLLTEDIEFEDDARDMMEVLSRHRQIKLLRQNGTEITMDCQVMRGMARDRHHLFRMVLSKPEVAGIKLSITHALKQSFLGNEITDAATQLPNADSVLKYIELTQSFISGKEVNACFVYMRFETNKADRDTVDKILIHVGYVIARNLREDDTIGRAAEDALGIILVDVNKSTVHLALNRIRHMILNDPIILNDGSSYVPQVRQGGVMLHDNMSPREVIGICVTLLDEDKERDMVLFRDHTDGFNPFRK